jgi:hypothetical protein
VTATLVAGSKVEIMATHLCRSQDMRDVERRNTYENFNETAGRTWTWAGIGLASATTGIIVLGDSGNVYERDGASRTYNPVGPGGAQAIGWSFVSLGAIAGTAAIVDAVRAQGTHSELERDEIRGELQTAEQPCDASPAAGVALQVFAGAGETYNLGTSGPTGEFVVDIDAVLPEDFVWTRRQIEIVQVDTPIARLDLTPLFRRREAKAWAALPVAQCKAAKKADACEPVDRFVHQYPGGPHAAEAHSLLKVMNPVLRGLADEEAWVAIDGTTCRERSFPTPEEGKASCFGYRRYVERFSSGAHVPEAQRILADADKRIAALVEGRRQAAEQEQQRQERERRRQQREAEAAEKREQAEVRNRCVATCQHECMGVQFANKALCLKGCVNVECDNNLCEGYCQADCATWSKAGIPNCASTCIYGRCGGQQ